ncbi:MAG TPA: carboxypeptidase-like regulatory domain-containing protein, partial [Ignavibacteria bacterium]
MKKPNLFLILLFVLLCGTHVFAQNGKIVGKVFDESNGSILPDAVIKTEPLSKGAASDLDGRFSVEKLTPGQYKVTASYVGYVKQTKRIEIKAGEVLNIDFVLKPEGAYTDTVTIEAERVITNSESGLLLKQQKSENIFDGISEQQIKRAPDAAASDVLKRVMGVSIVKDKFIFVRGTSERYNNTTLNGVLLPSTESDKKAFSFDLFPSNLLDNVIISKTFTPDQPGNFSGGLVQITTKEFPEKFTFNYSITGSYNTNTTGEKFYDYSAGEKKVWFLNLGLDNGSRELPAIIPDLSIKNSNFTRDEIKDFSRSFGNNWGQLTDKAPLNSGFQLSAGNVFNLGKIPIGILGAYSYKNAFSQKDIETNEFNTDHTQLSGYKGRNSEFSVLWGGLLNLNAKFNDFNKIGFKFTYTVNSEDETEYYEGFYAPEGWDRKKYITHFTQRTLLSSQLFGEHYFEHIAKLNLNWRGSYSESDRKEPDMKTMTY